MDLNNLTLFNAATQNIKYLSERQKVLAANVANVNTPGYVAQDLTKPNFSSMLKSSTTTGLRVTNEKHIASLPSQGGGGKLYTPKPTTSLTLDGNGVSLEDQLNEVSKNKSEHNRMLTIYGKYKQLLQTANTKINA